MTEKIWRNGTKAWVIEKKRINVVIKLMEVMGINRDDRKNG